MHKSQRCSEPEWTRPGNHTTHPPRIPTSRGTPSLTEASFYLIPRTCLNCNVYFGLRVCRPGQREALARTRCLGLGFLAWRVTSHGAARTPSPRPDAAAAGSPQPAAPRSRRAEEPPPGHVVAPEEGVVRLARVGAARCGGVAVAPLGNNGGGASWPWVGGRGGRLPLPLTPPPRPRTTATTTTTITTTHTTSNAGGRRLGRCVQCPCPSA